MCLSLATLYAQNENTNMPPIKEYKSVQTKADVYRRSINILLDKIKMPSSIDKTKLIGAGVLILIAVTVFSKKRKRNNDDKKNRRRL